MGNALLSGVSGMKAHQQMIDVAGHNLANLNTTAFKSSRVTFMELLSETLREASQPTSALGGTNPVQIGSGTGMASVDRIITQGTLANTGQALDMAIEGAGYFVLNDGESDIYTRVGAFGVDSYYNLVDPVSGYRVQRVGNFGVSDGFQDATNNSIRVPYDVALPAKETSSIAYTGSLSADQLEVTTNVLSSKSAFTVSGAVATGDTRLDQLDQATAIDEINDKMRIFGTKRDGTVLETAGVAGIEVDLDSGTVGETITVGELLTAIETAYQISGADTVTASMANGIIRVTDVETGYSKSDIMLEFQPDDADVSSLILPKHWQVETPGGNATKNTNIQIFDSQGVGHTLSASFVRTDIANVWDMVVTSVTGDVELVDRRVNGISFLTSGQYGGLVEVGGITDTAQFEAYYAHDPLNKRTITLDLGTIGEYGGLSQFGGDSTVSPSRQDGYATGWLSTLAVTRDGKLTGLFTNGIRRDIAALRIATFQNPSGLMSIGNNFFQPSANSGDAQASQALSGGAGAIRGGMLEKSNVDIAEEFVNLIQAQNGFQANSRTVRVSTEMLRELTNLIR